MKKPYEKPTMEFVEFRPEERLASCCRDHQGMPNQCNTGRNPAQYTNS